GALHPGAPPPHPSPARPCAEVNGRRGRGDARAAGATPPAARPERAGSGGDDRLEAVVALAPPLLHSGCAHAVAGLARRVDGVAGEAGATVAEVVESQRFDAHSIRESEELERLDRELVLAHRVEHAAERVLVALGVAVHVAPVAARAEIPLGDVGHVAV